MHFVMARDLDGSCDSFPVSALQMEHFRRIKKLLPDHHLLQLSTDRVFTPQE